MLGTKERQFALLINVSLDQLVPADHFYRQLDRTFDLSIVRDLVRDRYGLESLRRFFEAVVEQWRNSGLVWGKELYVDATKVVANASLDSVGPRFAIEAQAPYLSTACVAPGRLRPRPMASSINRSGRTTNVTWGVSR